MTANKGNPTRNLQCKKWEKERRERLNESFHKLAKQLPCYDPSITISKIEILLKSADYILKLRLQVDAHLKNDANSDTERTEIKELQEKIEKLQTRNAQLAQLLKDAKIQIPSECEPLPVAKTKKWSGKFSPEKAIEMNKLEAQADSKTNETKVKGKKIVSVSKKKQDSLCIKEKKPSILAKTGENCENEKTRTTTSVPSTEVPTIVNTIRPVQPYYLIANNISSTIPTQATTVVKSVMSAPILSTANQPSKTFILPVVQSQTILNPLVLNTAPAASSTVIVVKSSKADQSRRKENSNKSATNNIRQIIRKLPPLKPKRRTIGKLLQSNKVAIPASRYDSSFLLWPSTPQPIVKKRIKDLFKRTRNKKRKLITNHSQNNQGNNIAKKSKDCIAKSDNNEKDAKNDNLGYSIDAICKEKQSNINFKEKLKDVNENNKETSCDSEKHAKSDLSVAKIDSISVNTHCSKDAEQKQQIDTQKNQIFNQIDSQFVKTTEIVKEQVTVNETQTNTVQTLEEQQHNTMNTQEASNRIETDIQLHSELSNDIFATLQVQGSQNPESTSPTAAFLNAFPLVSSFTGVKVTEVMEDEPTDSPHGSVTLLQIGTIDGNQKQPISNGHQADHLTPSLMNLDNFNFFNGSLYQNFDTANISTGPPLSTENQSCTDSLPRHPEHTKNENLKPPQKLFNQEHNHSVIVKNSNNISTILSKDYKTSAPDKNSNANLNKQFVFGPSEVTNATNSSETAPFYETSQVNINTRRAVVSTGINFNSTNVPNAPSSRYNECNTFNPFELPRNAQSLSKNCNESSYNAANCNYNCQGNDFNYQLTKNNYYESNNCNFYTGSSVVNNQATVPNANNVSTTTKKKVSEYPANKNMVNWMAPDFSPSTTNHVAKVTSYSDFTQTNYFNNSSSFYPSEYQSNNGTTEQDHQFSWSPTKFPQLLDAAAGHNFPPTTLPTLVGDLALGISNYGNNNQLFPEKPAKTNAKSASNSKKHTNHTYENSGNFLSVSQLVERNKDPSINQATRVAKRSTGNSPRNSNKPNAKSVPRRHAKEKTISQEGAKSKMLYDPEWDTKRNKTIINYSAESLIGIKQQNYAKAIPPYLPDNLIPYFPANIDDNFAHNATQQNYQATNFNSSFIPPPSTNTTYLPTNNFIPDMFDNPIENIFSHSNPTTSKPGPHSNTTKKSTTQKNLTKNEAQYNLLPIANSVTNSIQQTTLNGSLVNAAAAAANKSKAKKKDTFVDLSFLSMPSMNSPLLPDDYHGNFLPPPNHNQMYHTSCKNPLYKQGSDLGILPLATSGSVNSSANRTPGTTQQVDISPASSSLTNFNLCTIFPEINRTSHVASDIFRN